MHSEQTTWFFFSSSAWAPGWEAGWGCRQGAHPVCRPGLGSRAGLPGCPSLFFSLVEAGEPCLKGSIPDRRLLLLPCRLCKLPYLWFHSTAFIGEVIRVMFYPIWSKFSSYLCTHQRECARRDFVAEIQWSKTGSEHWIQQLNLVDQ